MCVCATSSSPIAHFCRKKIPVSFMLFRWKFMSFYLFIQCLCTHVYTTHIDFILSSNRVERTELMKFIEINNPITFIIFFFRYKMMKKIALISGMQFYLMYWWNIPKLTMEILNVENDFREIQEWNGTKQKMKNIENKKLISFNAIK